jgi:ABC-2 family transporter protein
MTTVFPPPLIAKELRALAPWWLASVFVIGADAYARYYRIVPIGLLTFVIGTLALGAQSVGHEYSNRTLDALLAQPYDRRRVFAAKLFVLLPLVLALGIIAWLCVTAEGVPPLAPSRALALFMLPPLLAITLAPWMTMMTQSTLAGVVFTAAVPGVLWTLLNIAAVAFEADYGSAWIRTLWIGGLLSLCAAGAVLGWQRFLHLQAVDARGIEVMMPRIRRASRARWRHPLWMLLQKELRLQQLTFAVALMYVTAWAAFALGTRVAGGWDAEISAVLNLLYFTILSMLIGSLASAQERHFGTADAQMVLPVGAWKQWAIKSGTALALALTLGLVVPVVLDRLAPAYDTVRLFHGGPLIMASIIAVLTVSSLYVSSLCRSGVAAMVFSFPALVGSLVIVQTVGGTAALAARAHGVRPLIHGSFMQRTLNAFVVCGIGLLLWLGGRNQRFSEGDGPRIWRQLLLIAVYLSTGAVVLGVLSVL